MTLIEAWRRAQRRRPRRRTRTTRDDAYADRRPTRDDARRPPDASGGRAAREES